MEYASNGKGNLGVTLGAIGTGLGALSNSGLFSGLLGGNATNTNNSYVSKEVLDLQLQLVDSKQQNAILSADLNSEKKMVEVFNAANDKINNVYERVSDRILALERTVSDNVSAQAVINCNCSSAVNLLQNQVTQLFGMTKLAIPNSNICPGWGTANVTVSTGTTTA